MNLAQNYISSFRPSSNDNKKLNIAYQLVEASSGAKGLCSSFYFKFIEFCRTLTMEGRPRVWSPAVPPSKSVNK